MPAPTCAAAVANAFLDLQAAETGPYVPIDQMKLQKLVFYSHAWWLAQKDGPLFDDDVEAWPWGPVVRTIYYDFKDFGRLPIAPAMRAKELVKVGDSPLDYVIRVPEKPDTETYAFLKQVWDSHKNLSGVQLSNATHMPGEPWTLVKESYGNLEKKPTIPNALIRDVFRAKLQNRGNPAA